MAAPQAVRKTVTVLFCDVAGSTGLGEQLDPELLRGVMGSWFDSMRDALEKHGGTVEKFIGDAIMAVFGVPTVHEDDALRAVRAAGEMRRRLDALNERLQRNHGVTLAMRIGINTGPVVAGDPSGGHGFVTGDAVNVAKRLEEAARPGEILIGKATYPLIRDAVKVGPLERFSAKGKRDGAERRRVDEIDLFAPALARRLDVPMVGREAELGLLRHSYERVTAERSCRLFTVLGPAGIGKSRLAAELCSSAGDATTVTGRCLPYGEGITFWPLAEIVRELGGEQALRRALAGDEDADAVADLVLAGIGAAEGTAQSEELFWAVRRAFELVARERPLVVCFDDIHWAEPTLLDLIEYVVGWSRGAPILVLCLARPELVDQRPTWIALQETADSVALEPLPAHEISALLDRFAGEAPLGEQARERIARAAEGNPLFVEQMAAMAAESPGDEELSVPPSIQALLAERLDRLSAAEQAVIRRASVIGRDFAARDVIALSPEEERPLVASRLLALLRKGLVRPDVSRAGPEDRFRFHHVLVRDTAYEGLPKEVRAELHEQLASLVEERAAEGPGELEEIAGYHLEQAHRSRTELGLVDARTEALGRRASGLLSSAGRRALDRADMRAAARLLARARALVPPDAPERLALAAPHATALITTGELGDAERVLEEALAAAAAAGARDVEAACLIVRASLRFATHPDHAVDEAEAVARHTIEVFGEAGDDAGLAKAWRLRAYAAATRGRWGAAAEHAEQALVHARRVGLRELSEVTSLLPVALLYGPTPAEDAILRCEAIREGARGNRHVEAAVAGMLAPLLAMQLRFEEARALAVESTAVLEDLGTVAWLAHARAWRAHVEYLAGRFADAERELRLAHEVFDRIGDRVNAAATAALVAETLDAQGRSEEADEWTDAVDPTVVARDVFAHVAWGSVRARALARTGRLEEAERIARETLAVADDTDAPNMRGDAAFALGTVLRAAGREREAAEAFTAAVELYRAKGNLASAERVARSVGAPAPVSAAGAPAARAAVDRPSA